MAAGLLSIQASAQLLCGNDQLQQKLLTQSRYATQKAAFTRSWEKFNAAMSVSKMIITGKDTVYEIPVVVHIVHTGGPVGSSLNPADTTIISMIDYLNKSWAATWPTYADTFSGGTRIPVKFVLAKRNPSCAATTGINRVNGATLSGYTSNGVCPFGSVPGPSDQQVKSLSLWPTRDYFNIWLVNEIEGGGVGGYAPWPWFTGADLIDGAVICTQYASRLPSGDYYNALPHEVGHSFGLYHTFQDGCDPSGSCLTSGDELCDTEPHDFVAMTCDAGKVNSCTGVLFKGVEHNIMNYSSCPDRFTKDQRSRVIFTTWGFRMGLVNSMGGTAPSGAFVAPKTACIPGILNPSNDQNFGPCNIRFAGMVTSSSGYKNDGNEAYLDRTCIQAPVTVVKGATYPISVSTIDNTQNVRVWIDYNNDGTFQSTELVFSHIGTSFTDETHTGSVTVPASGVVTNVNIRMRVMADVVLSAAPTACSSLQYGQAEDYTVVVADGTTGVNDRSAARSGFTLFPSPASGQVTLSCTEDALFSVFSTDGKVLLQGVSEKVIDVSTFAPGLYFVRAVRKTDGSLIGVQKLHRL